LLRASSISSGVSSLCFSLPCASSSLVIAPMGGLIVAEVSDLDLRLAHRTLLLPSTQRICHQSAARSITARNGSAHLTNCSACSSFHVCTAEENVPIVFAATPGPKCRLARHSCLATAFDDASARELMQLFETQTRVRRKHLMQRLLAIRNLRFLKLRSDSRGVCRVRENWPSHNIQYLLRFSKISLDTNLLNMRQACIR
jgi:hypothetical protein